uniref:Glycoside hydrolase family 105 protein n=1 Tax=Phytophthora ramorum TaxID=164328 RepID=H3GZ61_PHYRM
MRSFPIFHLVAVAIATVTTAADLPYSTRMIESVVSREQGVVSSGAVTSTLESGILTLAIQSWLNTYSKDGDSERVANFTTYADSIVASISPSFKGPSAAAKMPLDRFTIGQALLDINATQGSLTTAEAETLTTLISSLVLQNRNQYNGFWYYVYPYWSYLDGAVSFLPYMAAAPGWSYEDMLSQIELLYNNTYDNTTALAVHGYDASKTAVWANKATGASPYVWGRSLGWYLAGLVNAWEQLGDCHGGSNADCVRLASAIQLQASQLCESIVTYADTDTGVWWQLPTFGGKQGNFLESSSTMLYTFAILKGLRLGLLKDNATSAHGLQTAAMRAYNYTVTKGTFLLDYGNGTLGWNGTVAVCSLNSTATYEYYVGRPIVHNHALGEGAFILASLEVEQVAK